MFKNGVLGILSHIARQLINIAKTRVIVIKSPLIQLLLR